MTELSLASRVARSFRDTNYLATLGRSFDERPIQCSLYVTDRCNLDCGYCTEYDNSQRHPPLEVIRRRLQHVRDLGVIRVAFVGGEPLLHPDIVQMVAYARELGLATSLTTNGFPLTAKLIDELAAAGLEVMQISVDRMTPTATTRKSVKSVARRIEMVARSSIKLHITGVLCADTIDESLQVVEYGLKLGVPTEVRLVHSGPDGLMRVAPGERQRLREVLEWMRRQKRAGAKIHTTDALLQYQLDLLDGRPRDDWTCAAGYKIFFVSAKGKFMECSMRPTERDLLEMTIEEMRTYFHKKDCQAGCGVYCSVGISMFRDHPVRYVSAELLPRARQVLNEITRPSGGQDVRPRAA